MNQQLTELDIDKKTARLLLNATSLIFLFIFYAALLPYNIVSSPRGVSLIDFIETLKYSPTGEEQGQWIAHIIFTALLTFVASMYAKISGQKKKWLLIYVGIVVFGFLVEYCQMFIGSRGISLEDIYANLAGLLLGFILWKFFGKFANDALKYFLKYKMLPIDFVRKFYLAFVIIIILFPFDFFINGLQLEVAFATKGVPLFESAADRQIGIISLAASILLLFPLGMIYQYSNNIKRKNKSALIIKYSFILLILEILQFFEMSGQSSLLSYFCKIFGFSFGLYFARLMSLEALMSLALKLRLVFLAILPVFIYVVLKLKGMSFEYPFSIDSIFSVIETTSFLPFRYYVDVGSGEALLSFLINFVIFMPIGAIVALQDIYGRRLKRRHFLNLFQLGAGIALMFELIVLFWGAKTPDITNIIISAFALPLGYNVLLMVNEGIKISSDLNQQEVLHHHTD
ncbi:MAG: VanZ family protein [Kordiimonadaceae bacterium]|nr:VanZ family protein [Kordiimonadaceae bacterium]